MASLAQAIEQDRLPTAAPARSRLVSLDAFRGFTMFWIIGGGALMEGVRALGHSPVLDTIVHHLHHSAWQGLRYYDLIWPSFMLIRPCRLGPRPSGRGTVLSTIPAIATTIAGLLVGELLISSAPARTKMGTRARCGRASRLGAGPLDPGRHETVDELLWDSRDRLGVPVVPALLTRSPKPAQDVIKWIQ